MKSSKTAWRALREPVTFRQAAKLLGVAPEFVGEMVATLELMTIRVDGRELIPACELRRFKPSR